MIVTVRQWISYLNMRQSEQNIKYIWIQCDLKHSVQKLLDFLPLLKNLKILHLDDAEGFKKEDFFKILEISPSLEVRLYISLNTSITKLTFRCSDYREASLLRRISGFPSWTLTLEIGWEKFTWSLLNALCGCRPILIFCWALCQ